MSNYILYSTGCPSCIQLKTMLDRRNVSYTEVNDVEKILSELSGSGIDSVPALKVDDKIMTYEEAKRWIIERGI